MNWRGGKSKKNCEQCLLDYKTYREKQRFCSKACYGLDRKINDYPGKYGKQHWTWKGGITKDKVYVSWLKNRRNRFVQKIRNHTFQQWQELKQLYRYTCPRCNRSEPEIKLTEDHIIPLARGGDDYIGNIQPLCRVCNGQKHLKLIYYEPILGLIVKGNQ